MFRLADFVCKNFLKLVKNVQKLSNPWRSLTQKFQSFSTENKPEKTKLFYRRRFSLGGPNDPIVPELPSNLRKKLLILGAIFGLPLSVYAAFNVRLNTVPYTGRKRLTYMSSSLERNYGKYLTDVTLEQYKDSIISDPSTNAILAQIYRVGNRICQANGLPPHKYYLIKAKLPNAFVFGAETVFVFEGILDAMQDSDGMAMVLSHEMAHVIAGHLGERFGILAILTVGRLFLKFFGGIFVGDWSWKISQLVFEMPISRKLETEADYIGLRLLANSCFDVQRGIAFFERMKQKIGDNNQESAIFSTHPSFDQRLANLSKWISEDPYIKQSINKCNAGKSKMKLV